LKAVAHYFESAADHGHIMAQNNSGICLQKGKGVSKDLKEAAHYYKLAADHGDADAQYNYGFYLQKGEVVGIDFQGAAHYFKLAADQGYDNDQCNSAICLQNGEGVSINFKGAAHYFKLAADQGFADAQNNYGICLLKGEVVSKDFHSRKIVRCATPFASTSRCLCSVIHRRYSCRSVTPIREFHHTFLKTNMIPFISFLYLRVVSQSSFSHYLTQTIIPSVSSSPAKYAPSRSEAIHSHRVR
jgi:hypothetical protein